jgi:hypothetical protein
MRSFLILVVLAGTASAGNNEVSFESTTRSLRSSSADAVTGDSLVGGDVGIGRALGVELPRHFTLWSDAGITWSGATGTMFSVLATDLFDTTITAGLHLRYRPIRYVAISAGIAIGAQHASLSITDSMDHTASDTAWGAVARASMKLDLLAVDLPRFSFGVRAEFGYLLSQGIELVPTEQRTDDSDTLHIPMSEASLGHLDLGGAFFNIGLVSQF